MRPFRIIATAFCVALLVGSAQQGWYPHEGGLLKYRVNIRFGEEPVKPPGVPLSVQAKRDGEIRLDEDPDTMPEGWKLGRVSAVSTDSAGEVFAFHRGAKADPILVFDAKGRYLRSWGRGMFGNPHGLRVDREDNVWVTDEGDHQVMKFDRKGRLLITLGKKGKPGADAETFNRPTDIAFAPSGEFYVSDGYGNARIVKFSRQGKYLFAWGRPGAGRAEFNTPHSVAVDSKGAVYVSDRENNRIQIFDSDGKFLRQWTHLGSTQSMFITPADGLWIITDRHNVEASAMNTLGGRIMHLDQSTGRILGSMESPGHSIHVTPLGEIFIGSLTGNVFRYYPGWVAGSAGSEEGLRPNN